VADIHIVVDSTAHVPDRLLAKYRNLHVVSLQVILGEKQWPEDQLSPAKLFTLVKESGVFLKTSQPSIGDFTKVFEPLVKADQEIIVITLSGALSGTAQGARAAAQMISEQKIHIIDSQTTAMGLVRLVEAALTMADSGMEAKAIVERLQAMVRVTHTMFVPATLEYLHKGGRIGGAAALFGTILQIKPVLYLVEGKVAVLDKVRTRPKAAARMLEELKKYTNLAYVGVAHSEALAEAEALSQQIRELYPYTKIIVSSLSPVLGAHLGPGVIGLIYQEEIE